MMIGIDAFVPSQRPSTGLGTNGWGEHEIVNVGPPVRAGTKAAHKKKGLRNGAPFRFPPFGRNLVFLSNEVRQASVAAILAAFAPFTTIPARSTAAFAATTTANATAAFTARTTIAARFTRFAGRRSEEHQSELQSLMRLSYAVFCLK